MRPPGRVNRGGSAQIRAFWLSAPRYGLPARAANFFNLVRKNRVGTVRGGKVYEESPAGSVLNPTHGRGFRMPHRTLTVGRRVRTDGKKPRMRAVTNDWIKR